MSSIDTEQLALYTKSLKSKHTQKTYLTLLAKFQKTMNNPTVGMNDCLHYDRVAREQLTKLTRMLMAAANDKDFSTVSFMLDDGERK